MGLQEPTPIKSSVSLLLSGQQRLNYHKYLITRTKLAANYVEAKKLKNGENREKYSEDCLINEVRFTNRLPYFILASNSCPLKITSSKVFQGWPGGSIYLKY